MNFQQLEYVMAVHKHKHFGIAADSCHITQATLSAMIKKLEEELKILLFDRSRKPIQTTDMGLQFIETARTILQQKELLFSLILSGLEYILFKEFNNELLLFKKMDASSFSAGDNFSFKLLK